MSQKPLLSVSLYGVLFEIDREEAERVWAGPCPFCGGRLDRANYTRLPRGGPEGLAPVDSLRFSLCCAREGCRRRVTPRSVRFLGRRVFYGAVVVFLAALRQGPTAFRARRWSELLRVSRRTLARWCEWWRTTFAESAFWQQARGLLEQPIAASALPLGLLQRFPGNELSQLQALLCFIAPITAATALFGGAF